MKTRLDIENELKSLNSSLPANPAEEAYSVPPGYFEGLAATLLARIQEEDPDKELNELSPLLSSIPKTLPFSLPEGYFEETQRSLPAFTREEEPLFAPIGKTLPYTVPDNYFEALPAEVLGRVAPRGRVVPLGRRLMRWAVAASVVGIIALSGYFYLAGRGGDDSKGPAELSNAQWLTQKLKNVNNRELEEFIISTVPAFPDSSRTQPAGEEMNAFLNDVPDKELESFLSQLPSDEETLYLN